MNHPGSFSFNLVKHAFCGNGNIAISPFSIWIALSLLHGGARHDTKLALESTLCITDEVGEAYAEMLDLMRHPKIDLVVANSAWSQYEFSQNFQNLSRLFQVEVRKVNFEDRAGVISAINQHVAEKTNNLIQNILNQLPSPCAFVLVNTLYFKAAWDSNYHASRGQWNGLDGAQAVEKMFFSGTSHSSFTFDDDRASFLFVPLVNRQTYMAFILPHENTAEGLAGLFNPQYLNQYFAKDKDLHSMATSRGGVHVKIPKFDVSFKVNAQDLLSRLGLEVIFSSNADLLDLVQQKVCVDQVIHQAVVKVNEYGVEAAAATVITARLAAAIKLKNFSVDRPFMFLIWDEKSKVPLFVGKIVDPTQN